MTSLNELPVKRKRGRPPKKQPVDIYMSFTSLFQTLTNSTSPSAESNSNLMIKLGEPNSFTPMMKVSPSVIPTKLKRRRTNSFGLLPTRLQSPNMPSSSASPNSRKFDIGLPTPVTTKSTATPVGGFSSELDYKLSDEVFNLGVFQDDGPMPNLPMKSRSLSNFDLPYAPSQYTPRLSFSSACHSDLEPYCRTINLATLKGFEDEGVLSITPQSKENLVEPKTTDESGQAFLFNLVVDGRGRASISVDKKETPLFQTDTTNKANIPNIELKSEDKPEANLTLTHEALGNTEISSFSALENSVGWPDGGHHAETSVNNFDINFSLSPQSNPMISTMNNVTSPPHGNWPSSMNCYPEHQQCGFLGAVQFHYDQNYLFPPGSVEADTTTLYKTVNVNTLPSSEAGDAGTALRRAFGMP